MMDPDPAAWWPVQPLEADRVPRVGQLLCDPGVAQSVSALVRAREWRLLRGTSRRADGLVALPITWAGVEAWGLDPALAALAAQGCVRFEEGIDDAWLARSHPQPAVPAAPVGARFTFVELFAGVGGFRRALEALGGHCVLACECDVAARELWGAPAPHPDVRLLRSLPPHTLLAAGFPCQSFSSLGEQQGLHEARGQLVFEVLRLLRATPSVRAVVLENVPGLATLEEGAALRHVVGALQRCGFAVATRMLQCAAAVAQQRKRIFVVGVREHQAPERPMWGELPQLWPTFAAIRDDTSEREYLTPTQQRALEPLDARREVREDAPLRTVMASYRRGASKHSQFVRDAASGRLGYLTPREVARAQGFPDTQPLALRVAPAHRIYHLLGNAVPPPVAAVVCSGALAMLGLLQLDEGCAIARRMAEEVLR